MNKSKATYRLGGTRKGGSKVVYVHENESKSSFPSKSFFIILALLAFIYLLYYLHINSIIVWFNRSLFLQERTLLLIDLNILTVEFEHYFWSLMNGLMMGVYLSALLPLSGKRSKYVSFALIAFVVLFTILSLGYLGILIYIRLDFLQSHLYISNQREGIEFFLANLIWFSTLYAISFIIESEVD